MAMYLTPWDEKRRAFRLKAGLPLQYEFINENRYGNVLTQDISESGVRMISDAFMPRMTKLNLQINLTPLKLIKLNGEIKWSQRVPHSYHYQAGIEFKDLDHDTRRSLSEYVAFHR